MVGPPASETIFISVAAYRDPELIPTLDDCLAKAARPDRLRFGICWQHGPEESRPDWLLEPQFRVLDVDWRESRGACWARSEIMGLYRGEDWYLQLDSHHRFTLGWDARLIDQARLTGSARPVLSTYAAAFSPREEPDERGCVTTIEFDRFTPEGAILTAPGVVGEPPELPMRARFVSAHFLFAPGRFVDDVPYDPDLYFIGEEITLAVRAFTHGYDLFHPHEHFVWHEYTRAYRPRHWDDHTNERGIDVPWYERDANSLRKVGRFLIEPRCGRYELGTTRTLADYEAYAGVSFKHRRVQDYTRLGERPPSPPASPDWATRVQDYTIDVRLNRSELPAPAVEDPDLWYIGFHDGEGREIYRRDADGAELRTLLDGEDDALVVTRRFASETPPASWTVLPRSASKGWLTRITRSVRPDDEIFISIAAYRDTDLVPTIEDCLATACHPERLRFGICWQRDPGEVLPSWIDGPAFRVQEVDWRASHGQSWARAEVMRLYDGEGWYLQLDSHHRFAPDWDAALVTQAALTGTAKPLLSAPAPHFSPSVIPESEGLWQLAFAGFREDGIPDVKVVPLVPTARPGHPIPARSVCAHFIFAPGSFVDDVPYDPGLYFGHIELTVAVRAFTHGYELFQPGCHILWHDYRPSGRRRHWEDHTGGADGEVPWQERYQTSLARIADFHAGTATGRYGLGTARSLADYEAYAGISFRHRRVQDHTLRRRPPPNPPADPDWPLRVEDRRIEIEIDRSALPAPVTRDPSFWYVGIHDAEGMELSRQDADAAELRRLMSGQGSMLRLVREFASESVPASWTVIPHSASEGWLDPITGAVDPAPAAV